MKIESRKKGENYCCNKWVRKFYDKHEHENWSIRVITKFRAFVLSNFQK